MNIQQTSQDPRIVMMEEEFAWRNEHCRYTDEAKHVMEYMLEERHRVLCRLTEYDDETKTTPCRFQ